MLVNFLFICNILTKLNTFICLKYQISFALMLFENIKYTYSNTIGLKLYDILDNH